MKGKKSMSDFSLADLRIMKKELDLFDTLEEYKASLDRRIQMKEKTARENPNILFDREMFVRLQVFDAWELQVLDLYQIHNLQELIDLDLDSLVDVPYFIREKLAWARKFYDLRGMVKGECSDGKNK